jgi:pathogenesis-related protein 1
MPKDVKWAIDLYIQEKKQYHGEAISVQNYKEFGHYTQVIWNNTTHVGCAEVTGKYGSYVVCHYYPSGNVIGKKPYY